MFRLLFYNFFFFLFLNHFISDRSSQTKMSDALRMLMLFFFFFCVCGKYDKTELNKQIIIQYSCQTTKEHENMKIKRAKKKMCTIITLCLYLKHVFMLIWIFLLLLLSMLRCIRFMNKYGQITIGMVKINKFFFFFGLERIESTVRNIKRKAIEDLFERNIIMKKWCWSSSNTSCLSCIRCKCDMTYLLWPH